MEYLCYQLAGDAWVFLGGVLFARCVNFRPWYIYKQSVLWEIKMRKVMYFLSTRSGHTSSVTDQVRDTKQILIHFQSLSYQGKDFVADFTHCVDFCLPGSSSCWRLEQPLQLGSLQCRGHYFLVTQLINLLIIHFQGDAFCGRCEQLCFPCALARQEGPLLYPG